MGIQSKQLGTLGEEEAARDYQKDGYRILDMNYRCRFGEIDIIAQGKGCIVFAEVKLRAKNSLYSPVEAVTYQKQKKLVLTAQKWLISHPSECQPRFDVVELRHENGKIICLERIEDAFHLN